MSELPPRANTRLDNFEANKAAQEQMRFEQAVYGNAGHLDHTNKNAYYSDQAKRRVTEGFEYERHLEAMAQRGDSDPFLADLNGQPSPAYERERDEAIAENETFDGEHATREQAISDKIANTPELRRMQMLANDIAQLRSRTFDETNADRLEARLKDKEDRLNELLVEYSERELAEGDSHDDDAAVIDRIVDSTVAPTETSAPAAEAATATPERDAEEDEESDEDEHDDDVEHDAHDHDEADADEDGERAHVIDTSNRPDIDTSWAGDDEENGPDAEESQVDEATDVDTSNRPDVNTDWAGDGEHRDDEGLDIMDGHDDEEEGRERRRNQFTWRNPFWRTHEIFSNARNRLRFRNSREDGEGKRGNGRMVAIAAGAIAIAGAFAAWKLGAFDHLFGHNVTPGHHGGTGGNGGAGGHGGAGGNGGAGTGEVPGGNGGTGATPEFPQAAYDVHPGEGWYETFQDMNVPQDEWSSVLQQVGPQLHEHGWAYVIQNGPYAGQWGISQPGQLPKEALELIQNAATEIASKR